VSFINLIYLCHHIYTFIYYRKTYIYYNGYYNNEVVFMDEPLLARFERKVLHRNVKNTSPKVSVPRWWVGSSDEVVIEIYPSKIVIRKIGRAKDEYLRAVW